jgi:transketolase
MPTSIDALKEKGRRLRILSLKATTEAGSGHPSSCLSAADLVSVIFFNEMQFDPKDPHNPANDRFILSKGHAAPLLWAAYAESGIIEEKNVLTLRRLDSNLEGHPTPKMPWVDVATGSLGQGLSAGLGNAFAARLDSIPYNTYVLLGDGECAEGSVWEAAALASYYKASNLFAIVDVNGLGQSQRTMDQFNVNRFAEKFRAFGWFAQVVDGHNYGDILGAFETLRRDGATQPRALIAKTFKGRGVSLLENLDGWHGKPLPKKDLPQALAELEKPLGPNEFIPNPRTGFSLPRVETVSNKLIERTGWMERITVSRKPDETAATREAYGDALVKVAEKDPRVVALDGDTKNSTFSEKLLKAYPQRFFEMFIAEQNMVGVATGLAARGKIPFVSTFAAFLTRAYDQIRMAGVSQSNVKFSGSHCGVSIGEDGPSQMGLEDIAMFRAIPGSVILYPSDPVSAERAVEQAARHHGICYIRTTRPKTNILYSNDEQFPIGGSKVLRNSVNDRVTVVAAGITVHEALKAAKKLEAEGISIRIIDAYCVKPIDGRTLLAAAAETAGRIVVVEDHYEQGGLGDAVLEAVGNRAQVVRLAVREIPRSGPPEALLDKYGISSEHIIETVKSF